MALENRDSIGNTIIVAVGLCLVCATIVSVAAVGLRSMQQANKLLDKKKNILAAAGLLEQGGDLDEIFESRVVDRIIDLKTGEDITDQYREEHGDPKEFDQIDVAESELEELATKLSDDPATIKWRENYSHVYLVKTSADDDTPIMYVFPIRGKGLWSILKGFIALDADLNTISGLTYYAHAETPGLGGEVDNPDWKIQWTQDKRLFDENGKVAMRLTKLDSHGNPHAVDALSGATITSRGVEKMLDFWMGEQGFQAYLDKLRASRSTQDNSIGASGG